MTNYKSGPEGEEVGSHVEGRSCTAPGVPRAVPAV